MFLLVQWHVLADLVWVSLRLRGLRIKMFDLKLQRKKYMDNTNFTEQKKVQEDRDIRKEEFNRS